LQLWLKDDKIKTDNRLSVMCYISALIVSYVRIVVLMGELEINLLLIHKIFRIINQVRFCTSKLKL